MNSLVVGVGDCLVTNDPDGVLVTHALGSCIAIMIYDPMVRVGGLLHFMLPDSGLDRARAEQNPFMFATTGVPHLFHSAYNLGAEKRRLVVTVAGGAHMMDPDGVFNIGKRNYLTVRKILWKAGVLVHAEDVGGEVSRTVRLEIATGRVWLRGAGGREQEFVSPVRLGKESVSAV